MGIQQQAPLSNVRVVSWCMSERPASIALRLMWGSPNASRSTETLRTSAQNAFAESFIGRLCDECLKETLFVSLLQPAPTTIACVRVRRSPTGTGGVPSPPDCRADNAANGQDFIPGLY